MSSEDAAVEELDFGFDTEDAEAADHRRLSSESEARRPSYDESQQLLSNHSGSHYLYDDLALKTEEESEEFKEDGQQHSAIESCGNANYAGSGTVAEGKQEMVVSNGAADNATSHDLFDVAVSIDDRDGPVDVNDRLAECRDQLAELSEIINPSVVKEEESEGSEDEFESATDSGSSVDSSASSESETGDERSSSSVSRDSAESRDAKPAASSERKKPSEKSGSGKDRPKKLCKSVSKFEHFYGDSNTTRFVLIKSGNKENVSLSKAKGVWATTPRNESLLNAKYRQFANVILIFSVERSQAFQGFCRLASTSSRACSPVQWVLPPGMSLRSLGGLFKVQWLCRCELPFTTTANLLNPWNDNKPVKIGRDGTEVENKAGRMLCDMFPYDSGIDLDRLISRVPKPAAVSAGRGGSPRRQARRSPATQRPFASSRRSEKSSYRAAGGSGGQVLGAERYVMSNRSIMNEGYYGGYGVGNYMPYGYTPYGPPPSLFEYYQPSYNAGPYPLMPGAPPTGKASGGNTEPLSLNREKYESRVAAFLDKTSSTTAGSAKRHENGGSRGEHARKRHHSPGHSGGSSHRRHSPHDSRRRRGSGSDSRDRHHGEKKRQRASRR